MALKKIWVLLPIALFSARSYACAKAEVVSGTECSNLKIQFNATACGGQDATRQVSSTCREGLAVARWKGKDGIYFVSAKMESSGWGDNGSWQAGAVSFDAYKKSAPKAKSEKVKPTPQAKATPWVPPVEAKAPEAAPARDVASNPIKFSGYVDVYYTYNTNKPSYDSANATGSTQPAAQNGPRYYDIYHDQMSLGLAELIVSRDAAPVGFRVDLGFGQWTEQNVTADEVSKHLSQAYVTYKPAFLPGATFDFGKMYTHLGYEVAHNQDNFNYSRSLTYGYALPFWHTGAKLTYPLIADRLTIAAAIYNGWATDLNDNNTAKSLGAQVAATPFDGFSVIYNIISGPELANTNDAVRTAHDLNFNWVLSPKVTLAGDFVHGWENQGSLSKVWSSMEVLAKFALGSWYSLSPRFELYNDKKDEIGNVGTLGFGSATVWNATLTNTFDMSNGLEFRLEGRYDKASKQIYKSLSKDAQFTFTAAGLLKF